MSTERTCNADPDLPIRMLRRRMTVKKEKTTIMIWKPTEPLSNESWTGSYEPD